jgi:hypothetical protein
VSNINIFEKIETGLHADCFVVLELFLNFIERTHALIGIGLPMLAVVGVHTFFGRWGDLVLLMLVISPAGAAIGKMIADCLALSKPR